MENQNPLSQENIYQDTSKATYGNIVIFILLVVFGLGGYFLGRNSVNLEKDKPVPPKRVNVQRTTPTISTLPTLTETPDDSQNTGVKKRVTISTCDLSIELPIQDSYTPVSFQHLVGTNLLQDFIDEQSSKLKRWSIEEEVDSSRTNFMKLQYDRRLNIAYLPGRLPIGAYACAPGCVKSPYFNIYCKADQRTLDQVVNEVQTALNVVDGFTPKLISKSKVDLWGEQVYELKHTGAIEFPKGSFYILSKNGLSYLVNVFGETSNFAEVFKSLRFGI